MKLNRIIITAGLSLQIMAASIVASAEPLSSPPSISNHSFGPCVVDVSDWPVGVLPDDANAAFRPAAQAACMQDVADLPVGVLRFDPVTGMSLAAVLPHSAGATSSSVGVGGAGAFVPPAHANGVFGAGGPLAGIGGAGAFIPGTTPST